MDDNLTPLLTGATETVSASAVSECCQPHYDRNNCHDHKIPAREECHCCNDIGSDYNELYYVTKFKKCDEYCCAKKGKDNNCDCTDDCNYDHDCGCKKEYRCDCDCKEDYRYDCDCKKEYKCDCDCKEDYRYDCDCKKDYKCDCDCKKDYRYDCDCKKEYKCDCDCKKEYRCDCDCKKEYKCDCGCKKESKCDYGCKKESKCDCGCKKESKHECCKEEICYYPPNKSCLKCSTPGSVMIPLGTLAGTTFTLTSQTIDTSKFKNPCIDFTFASNIVATAAISSVNFQIYKQCKCQFLPIPVGPVWTFSNLVTAISVSDTFTFGVCDCDSCNNDCCTYTVVATVTGVATVGTIAINNATLSALVVDNNTNCNC